MGNVVNRKILCFVCIIFLSGCINNKYDDKLLSDGKALYEISSYVNVDSLKEKYPDYFELDITCGIEVYIWQLANDVYCCGLMSGTEHIKTREEVWTLQKKPLTIDEAKAILNEINVCKDNVTIIPIIQPYSSYIYEINDDYIRKVNELFEREDE